MDPKDRAILENFAARVRTDVDTRARIWAYGSRVRGDPDAYSDLDVCVVLPHVDIEVREAVGHIAWEVGFEHDRLITTMVLADEEFEHGPMSAHPLVKSILREGLAA